MAEGRQQAIWSPTSQVLALLANIHRNPKKHRPFKPDDFNPWARQKKIATPVTKDNVVLLKQFFTGAKS